MESENKIDYRGFDFADDISDDLKELILFNFEEDMLEKAKKYEENHGEIPGTREDKVNFIFNLLRSKLEE